MNRIEFLNRFESNSTKQGYLKSFKKLDSFLSYQETTEEALMKKLNELEIYQKYNELQKLIDHIKETVSPRVTRNYFDNLFMYFLLNGVALDYTQKRIRLKFPRISENRFEGLDSNGVKTLLDLGSFNLTSYMSVLVSGGLRETEGLRITPSMFLFEEYPTRLKLPGEITKFSIPRETFVSKSATKRIREIIKDKNIKDNQTIFCENWNEKTLEDFEKYFATIRTKAGLDTKDRKKNQQNDITLHSFRAYFITTFTDNGLESFGHALAGHTKYMNTYYRKSIQQRQITYLSVADKLDF